MAAQIKPFHSSAAVKKTNLATVRWGAFNGFILKWIPAVINGEAGRQAPQLRPGRAGNSQAIPPRPGEIHLDTANGAETPANL